MKEEFGSALLACVGVQNNKLVDGGVTVGQDSSTGGCGGTVDTCWDGGVDAT